MALAPQSLPAYDLRHHFLTRLKAFRGPWNRASSLPPWQPSLSSGLAASQEHRLRHWTTPERSEGQQLPRVGHRTIPLTRQASLIPGSLSVVAASSTVVAMVVASTLCACAEHPAAQARKRGNAKVFGPDGKPRGSNLAKFALRSRPLDPGMRWAQLYRSSFASVVFQIFHLKG